MRKVIVVLLILTASTAVFSSDIALRIGHGAFLPGEKGELGLHALGGVSLGLTKRVELNLEVISPLVPAPFSDAVAGFEVGYSLLGDRNRNIYYNGSAMNTVVSLGLFASDHARNGRFLPTYLTLRITPVTIGTPLTGKRESFMPVGLAWNFREKTLGVFMSVMLYDHYIKGTWRDYESSYGK